MPSFASNGGNTQRLQTRNVSFKRDVQRQRSAKCEMTERMLEVEAWIVRRRWDFAITVTRVISNTMATQRGNGDDDAGVNTCPQNRNLIHSDLDRRRQFHLRRTRGGRCSQRGDNADHVPGRRSCLRNRGRTRSGSGYGVTAITGNRLCSGAHKVIREGLKGL